MADKFVVNAQVRDDRGKNDSRRLRVEGKVPVVVYGGGSENVSAAASLAELAAVIRSDSGINSVFALNIEGQGTHDVIFQDRQIDPIKGRLIHADLRRFAKGEKIEMTVQITLVGKPEGLSEEGAVMTQAMREIKVLCEPANTPDFIEVDVSSLEAGHALHVSDIKVGAGIEIHEDPEAVVAAISIISEESLEPQIEAGAEPEVAGGGAAEPEAGE